MERRGTPLVSIIIATYNRGDVLREAINSGLTQSYPNVEVVVIDDGSSDDTSAVLQEYGDRIVSHRQPNRGYAVARNVGLRLARGKYIAWLDSDDILHHHKTALQVAYMERHPDVVLTSSDFAGFDDSGPRNDSARTYYSAFASGGDVHGIYSDVVEMDVADVVGGDKTGGPCKVWSGHVLHSLLHGSFVHPPTVMMRRDAALEAGELDETLTNSVEYRFLFRLARLGRFAFIDRPLLHYRFSPGQFSGQAQSHSMSESILRILRELPQTDPDVVRAHPDLYTRRLSEAYLDMAYAFSRTDRGRALRGVAAAAGHGVITLPMLKIVARALLPAWAIGPAVRLLAFSKNAGVASLALALNIDTVMDCVAFSL